MTMAREGDAFEEFPIRDRYTVSGHVVGDMCFTCECRILELEGDEAMILAWCDCGWPDDAHEMEILIAGSR
jgi:hypothetical protein